MNATQPLQSELAGRDLVRDAMLLDEKLEAFRDKVPVAGTSPIDTEQDQPRWDGPGIIPEVAAADFDADKLRSAMASSGSLIVRGLIDPEFCESYQQVIDEVLSACENPPPEKQANPAPATPFRNPPSALQSLVPAQELQNSRGFHRLSGSAMCVESATVCLQLMDLYERVGLKEILADYLQDTPCLSVKKWVLRRSKLPVNPAGWHQDGAFMGADINSINMWIPLSRCGGDTGAPGMDVIPRRLTDIVQTGSDEAIFSWSVGEDQLAARQSDFQPVSPVFNPGDAFFFDHFNLHRTQYRESFTALRYAIETWFFSSSNFPKNQIPLAW